MSYRIYCLTLAVAVAGGCTQSSKPESGAVASDARYQLADEPEGAMGVVEFCESAQDGDPVVVVGCIGGGINPWVKGRAAFVLVDAAESVECDGACTDEDCNCRAIELADSIVVIKFLDRQGRVIEANAQALLGLEALDTVVVRGKAMRDKAGNVSVAADGVYIRR
jgi:hypothetical protein